MTTHASPEPAPGLAPANPSAESVAARSGGFWLIPLVLGIVTVVAGVLALAWPDETLLVVAVIFGLQLIAAGALRLAQALLRPGTATAARVLDAVIGVLFVAVGVLCLRDLVRTIAVLALLLGMVWLIGGLLEIVSALADGLPTHWTGRTVATLLTGIIGVLGGIVVLVYPDISVAALALILGLSLVLYGVAAVLQAFRLRSLLSANP